MTDQIEIIYCYRDRDQERIKNSLESLTHQENKTFSVIFIDYGSLKKNASAARSLCEDYKFCKYFYIDTEGKMWNRSDALNYGIKLATASYIFTSDIDLIFRPDFTAFLHDHIKPHQALFFPVGYLSEKETSKVGKQKFSEHKYEKSTEVALGMTLVSRSTLDSVNGYNSFYSLWGQEDNDLKYRLEKAGFKASFSKEVLMLHQYHAPSSTDKNSVPEGWIQFMKDYSENYNMNAGSFNGLKETVYPVQRPVRNLIEKSVEFHLIKGRKLFLRHYLINALTVVPEKELTFSLHPLELPASSKALKFVNFSGEIISAIKLPIRIKAAYEDQYLSLDEIKAEILFLVKSLDHFIVDYFLEVSGATIKIAIIKK